MKIKTFAINLEKRIDRKQHIIKEFHGRHLYDLTVFKAVEHENGAIGLWKSMREIVKKAEEENLEEVLICEDDHVFTKHYSDEVFLNFIVRMKELKADIFLGGISGFEDCIFFENNFLWINKFSGAQFMLVFKSFYQRFLSIKLEPYGAIDLKFSQFTDKIFCTFPFISVQKNFGYSDVTLKNDKIDITKEYFEKEARRIQTLKRVEKHFNKYYK